MDLYNAAPLTPEKPIQLVVAVSQRQQTDVMNESADALARIMRALQSELGVPAGVNAFIRALDQKIPVADLITHLRALRRYSLEAPNTASESVRCAGIRRSPTTCGSVF